MATQRGRRSAPASVLTFTAPVAGYPVGAKVDDTRANRLRFARAIDRGFLVNAAQAAATTEPTVAAEPVADTSADSKAAAKTTKTETKES